MDRISVSDRLSLRAQIALATMILCVLLVAAGSLAAALIGQRKTGELIGRELAELAASMADRLDRGMFERYREIGIIADLETLQPVWQTEPAVLRRTLEHLQASFPDYAWIGFADADGTVRAATRGMLDGASVAKRPWFASGLAGPFIGDVHEAVLLAGLLGPRTGREPFRFVDVAYPVHGADGAVIGVLGAHLSWDWAEETRRAVLAVNEHFTGAEILVLDSEGRVLLGPNTGARLLDAAQLARVQAQPGGMGLLEGQQAGWLTGYAVAGGYRSYPGLGWIVLARQPAAIASQPVRDLAQAILLVGFGLSLLGGLAAWILAGRLTRPVRQLTAEAERIGRDDHVHTLPRLGGAREVVLLSRALRSLLRRLGLAEEKLQEAEREIDHQAEETRELSADLERLRRLAETDPLTGLLNRRAFLDAAARQVAYARRYDRALAVVVADIDHFKAVNDRHGHAAGDVAIRAVAGRLQQAARDSDLVARFGGEEFVVLLMESDIAAAVSYAERVRGAIGASPVDLGTDGNGRAAAVTLTVSLGCTVLGQDDRDVQDAIDRADGALYAAKAAGRNRVRISVAERNAAE
ncbi:diguanylate cyclase [Ferrovibrio sp.]